MNATAQHPAPRHTANHPLIAAAIAALTLLTTAIPAPLTQAQPLSDVEATELGVNEMQGVGIEESNGSQIPLNIAFTDSTGSTVTLGDYFDGQTPIVLNLVYYNCPSMCTIQFSEMVRTLKQMKWTPGQNFQIITVSINPDEEPGLAALKKSNIISVLERPDAADGWHFLTGTQQNIETLAQAVGFQYRYVEDTMQYAHDSSLILVTPTGIVSKYIRGTSYDPQTLRLALVEASNGTVGTPLDRLWVTVCGYDAKFGKYVLQAKQTLAIGGVITMIALASLIALFIRWGRKRAALENQTNHDPLNSNNSNPERVAHA